MRSSLVAANSEIDECVTIEQKTDHPIWSPCSTADGFSGLLNVNHRPVIIGKAGTYDFKSAEWKIEWRKC